MSRQYQVGDRVKARYRPDNSPGISVEGEVVEIRPNNEALVLIKRALNLGEDFRPLKGRSMIFTFEEMTPDD